MNPSPFVSSSQPPDSHGIAAGLLPQCADADLVARCRDGDLTAFDGLVEAHQNRIFNVCYWMLGSREEAADAAQDAFVRAFRSLQNFRGASSFGTWLHRIAVNVSIDAANRRKRAPRPYADFDAAREEGEDGESFEERAWSTPGQSNPHETEPSQIALRRERRAAVRHALARLPEHYRVVLVLFDIEGHAYDEIAASLNLPLGTIKSRISRARLRLRDELQNVRELFED